MLKLLELFDKRVFVEKYIYQLDPDKYLFSLDQSCRRNLFKGKSSIHYYFILFFLSLIPFHSIFEN